MARRRRVLLTGATGFVGQRLYPHLVEAGWQVRCASRTPARAKTRFPDREWVRLDIRDPASIAAALRGCRAAVYLVHGLRDAGAYDLLELRGARSFAEAAGRAHLKRLVYLGGVMPRGEVGPHLRSRLQAGRVLREGPVPCVELRAAMIIGAGSASWQIVRDLAVRLPAMILPRFLESRSQPVAVDDVCKAIVHALSMPEPEVGLYTVPGPETLTGRAILERVAALHGSRPMMLQTRFIAPRMASAWIRTVTRVHGPWARELVEGLRGGDLIAAGTPIWSKMGHAPMPFEEAARRAMEDEAQTLPFGTRMVEALLKNAARRARPEAA